MTWKERTDGQVQLLFGLDVFSDLLYCASGVNHYAGMPVVIMIAGYGNFQSPEYQNHGVRFVNLCY